MPVANVENVEDLVDAAARLARLHLDIPELASRWRHVQGVARRASELAPAVPAADQPLLIAAAWLHDIGYAPSLVNTGMHAIDGALHLRHKGYPPRLVALVAHHTAAVFEAGERGLTCELDQFPREECPVADALATADLTTSPTGHRVELAARISEILARYPRTTAVHRAISRAQPVLVTQVERTLHRLSSASSTAGVSATSGAMASDQSSTANRTLAVDSRPG